jgi:poly-gamma-glutamate synthesis protein (capsule biosynthesis protein)
LAQRRTDLATAAVRGTLKYGQFSGIAMAGASVTLLLAGDVMTGRGIDQVLPSPSDPELFESYVRDARDYVDLAVRANGPIPRPIVRTCT